MSYTPDKVRLVPEDYDFSNTMRKLDIDLGAFREIDNRVKPKNNWAKWDAAHAKHGGDSYNDQYRESSSSSVMRKSHAIAMAHTHNAGHEGDSFKVEVRSAGPGLATVQAKAHRDDAAGMNKLRSFGKMLGGGTNEGAYPTYKAAR